MDDGARAVETAEGANKENPRLPVAALQPETDAFVPIGVGIRPILLFDDAGVLFGFLPLLLDPEKKPGLIENRRDGTNERAMVVPNERRAVVVLDPHLAIRVQLHFHGHILQ